VVQVTLSVLLLTATGLLVRTLYNLKTLDAGFDRANVLLVSLDTAAAKLPSAQGAQFSEELLGRLRRLPTVMSASLSTLIPADEGVNIRAMDLPGRPQAGDARGVWYNLTSPHYLKTLGIELLSGRDFNEQDRAGAQRVAIVNETMARFYFPDADAVGQRFVFASQPDQLIEIVGVARDNRQHSLRAAAPRMVYAPWAQADRPPSRFTAEIRSTGEPRTLIAAVQAEVRDLHKDAIVRHVRTMSEQVDGALGRERLLATLSTAFGGLALVLACIGLYGVMAYSVVRRTREMGIRMALGAARGLLLWQVLRESLLLVVLGVVIGLPLAVWAAPALGDLLYELSPTDPFIFFAAVIVLFVVAAVASYFPARRASRIQPAVALRHE
jgi:predicted permease